MNTYEREEGFIQTWTWKMTRVKSKVKDQKPETCAVIGWHLRFNVFYFISFMIKCWIELSPVSMVIYLASTNQCLTLMPSKLDLPFKFKVKGVPLMCF